MEPIKMEQINKCVYCNEVMVYGPRTTIKMKGKERTKIIEYGWSCSLQNDDCDVVFDKKNLRSVFEKNLSEPWFSLVKLNIKSVEGRLNKGDFANMKVGDCILFTNNELGFERKFTTEIKKINCFDNFEEYLENETLERCLPGIDNMEDGLNVYYKYYSKEDEMKYKIKAFTFEIK